MLAGFANGATRNRVKCADKHSDAGEYGTGERNPSNQPEQSKQQWCDRFPKVWMVMLNQCGTPIRKLILHKSKVMLMFVIQAT